MAWYLPSVSIDREIAIIASGQHGVVTRSQIRAVGASSSVINRRIRSGVLIPDQPGVFRFAGAPQTPLQELMVAVMGVGEEAVVSHTSAAWLWDLGFHPDQVHVTTTRSRWKSKPYAVHRSSDLYDHHRSSVAGIPVTTPARTLVDYGATVSHTHVERAFDEALRRKLVSLAEVRAVLDEVARQGRRGVGAARKVLETRFAWIEGTESPLEDEFARLVEEAGLPAPVPQYVLRDHLGVEARLDFAYPDAKVAIEIDGYAYHSDPVRFAQDRQRQNRVLLAGYRMLRFTARDLRQDPMRVVAEVRQALRQPQNPVNAGVGARR